MENATINLQCHPPVFDVLQLLMHCTHWFTVDTRRYSIAMLLTLPWLSQYLSKYLVCNQEGYWFLATMVTICQTFVACSCDSYATSSLLDVYIAMYNFSICLPWHRKVSASLLKIQAYFFVMRLIKSIADDVNSGNTLASIGKQYPFVQWNV